MKNGAGNLLFKKNGALGYLQKRGPKKRGLKAPRFVVHIPTNIWTVAYRLKIYEFSIAKGSIKGNVYYTYSLTHSKYTLKKKKKKLKSWL